MKRTHSLLPVILLYLANGAFAQTFGGSAPVTHPSPEDANNPRLALDSAYKLEIPLVDSGGVPGMYQDAEIEYSPQTGSWRLVRYNRGILLQEQNIEEVELILTQEHPRQAFVKVTGYFSMGCGFPPRSSHLLTGSTFEISVFDNRVASYPPGPLMGCTAAIVPFRRVIPLPVYGLEAGEYRYVVNGIVEGSFTLPEDNFLE